MNSTPVATRLPRHLARIAWVLGVLGGALTAPAAVPAPDAVIVPREVIVLFNGKDLSNFYTWLPKFGHADPDRVFTVVDQIDGAPAIRVSGQHWGGFVTTANYANYRLVAEFRWGSLTWKPRENKTRDSGILLHGQGEDGNAAKAFNSPWMRSVEYQIIEGGTGDIILVNGFNRGSDTAIPPTVTAAVRTGPPGNAVYWDPAGQPTTLTKGRINWQHRAPDWKDALGFRGPKDVEKPIGEWNLIEAIVEGGNFTYFLNGVKVNEARDGVFQSGRLLFQSEAAEIFFRRIELHPLKK